MSLKAGAKRSAAGAPFVWDKTMVGAVGMWESRERFPRAVGREGNLVLVFLASHSPSFPQSSPVLRAALTVEPREQFTFGFLHPGGGLGVGLFAGRLRELIHRPIRAQESGQPRQLPQDLPRRGVPAVAPLGFSFGVHH